jgi:hypothetical protein
VSIAFTVACQAFGRIDLAVATGDAVLGTQFQVVTAGPGITPVVVRSGGATTIERLAAGPYAVRMGGIPANCHSVDGVSRDVTVASGQAASVRFALACGAHGRMAFARLGDRHEND